MRMLYSFLPCMLKARDKKVALHQAVCRPSASRAGSYGAESVPGCRQCQRRVHLQWHREAGGE